MNKFGASKAIGRTLPGPRPYRIGVAAALALVASSPLRAQTIDYGALEQLFGQAVTTSATGSPEHESDVPVNMHIITANEIRRSGAADIPGVLRHVLGVDVMQWTSENADVGVRGYDQTFSPRVLVLVDGRQVYADYYGYTPWVAVPVELGEIRQIEVVEGPNAALFGFNAVNGVINIVTYNPRYDDVNTASATGGSQGMGQASSVQTFKFDGGGVRLSAGGQIDDDFATPVPSSEGTLPRIRSDRFAVDIDSVFRIGDNVQLEFDASHSAAASNDMGPSLTLGHDQHYTSSIRGQLNADTSLGLLQASVYHNWLSVHAHTSRPVPLVFENEVTVAQFEDLFRIGPDHTFRASVEYRYNTVNTSTFEGGTIFYSNYAASMMWNWNILPVLSLNNAIRWENLHLGRNGLVPAGYPFSNADWQRTITEYHYSSGLVWRASEANTLRLIFSHGVQLPSLSAFGAFVLNTPTANVTGNPDIQDTGVSNYEFDWDRTLPMLGGAFRAGIFYLTGKNFISIQGGVIAGSGPPPYRTFRDVGDSSAQGVELSLNGIFQEAWRWGVNYRYESIADQFAPFAEGGTDYVDYQHVTPKHVVKANLGWARGSWEIDSYFYYQSPTRGLETLPLSAGSFLSPVPDYFSVDARIAYRLTDWATMAISGQNLGSSSQKQTVGPAVERRVFATFSVNY